MKIIKSILFFIAIFSIIFFYLTLYPTKNLAKFVVKSNFEYFIGKENSNKHLNLYYDFLIQNYFKNNFLKNNDKINSITKKTKNFLIDQDEVEFFKEDVYFKGNEFSLGSIIIYGFGACESVNGILGLRLSNLLKENVELFALYSLKHKTSRHTLIRAKEGNKFFYIDIWGVQRDIKYTFEKSIFEKNSNIQMFNKNFYPKNRFLKDEFTNGFICT